MIDPKELRKGDYVSCTVHLPVGYYKSGVPFTQITGVKDGYVETDDGTRKYREIAAIPLTEQILLNAGGIKKGENEIVFTDTDTSTPDIILFHDADKYYLGSEQDRINKFSIPIESVHQFQNLYYDLMGKDIRINL